MQNNRGKFKSQEMAVSKGNISAKKMELAHYMMHQLPIFKNRIVEEILIPSFYRVKFNLASVHFVKHFGALAEMGRLIKQQIPFVNTAYFHIVQVN